MKRLHLLILLVMVIAITTSCANVHTGNIAQHVDNKGDVQLKNKEVDPEVKDLVISGKENKNLSTRYFGLIDFIFENNTDRWIRLKDVKVYFENTDIDQMIILTSGKDLSTWYKATKRQLLKESSKKQVAFGIIEALGEGIVLSKDNPSLQTAGAIAPLGLAESVSLDTLNKQKDGLKNATLFPGDHLYSSDISIPPGFFVQKWILLNTSNHKEMEYLENIYLDYKKDDDSVSTLKLKIRKRRGRWQDDVEFR